MALEAVLKKNFKSGGGFLSGNPSFGVPQLRHDEGHAVPSSYHI